MNERLLRPLCRLEDQRLTPGRTLPSRTSRGDENPEIWRDPGGRGGRCSPLSRPAPSRPAACSARLPRKQEGAAQACSALDGRGERHCAGVASPLLRPQSQVKSPSLGSPCLRAPGQCSDTLTPPPAPEPFPAQVRGYHPRSLSSSRRTSKLWTPVPVSRSL
jgi:hypothetical protein